MDFFQNFHEMHVSATSTDAAMSKFVDSNTHLLYVEVVLMNLVFLRGRFGGDLRKSFIMFWENNYLRYCAQNDIAGDVVVVGASKLTAHIELEFKTKSCSIVPSMDRKFADLVPKHFVSYSFKHVTFTKY